MRHKKVVKRPTQPDKIYNNVLVTKLINRIMKDGKKSVAEKLVYATLDGLKAKGLDPIATYEKVLTTVGPKVEIRAKRIGGANYQVPVEVKPERQKTLAIRWIVEAATSRPNRDYHSFDLKLVAEFLDALDEKGAAITKRNNTLKQADANRAFAHFRF